MAASEREFLVVIAALLCVAVAGLIAGWAVLRCSRLEKEKHFHEMQSLRYRGILDSLGYKNKKPSAMQAAAAAALAKVVEDNLKAELAKLPPPDFRLQLVDKQKRTGTE